MKIINQNINRKLKIKFGFMIFRSRLLYWGQIKCRIMSTRKICFFKLGGKRNPPPDDRKKKGVPPPFKILEKSKKPQLWCPERPSWLTNILSPKNKVGKKKKKPFKTATNLQSVSKKNLPGEISFGWPTKNKQIKWKPLKPKNKFLRKGKRWLLYKKNCKKKKFFPRSIKKVF